MSPTQSCFFKVNIKNYETQEVPFTGYKIFQISVALGRVYAIGEDGTLEVAFPKGDTLGQNVKPIIKAKDESDDEDDTVTKGKEYERKAVKIEDIPETVVDHPDAHNASILAGSEAEDDEEEEPHHQETSIKEKSYLSAILSEKNRKSNKELPASNCFYRTLAANENFVVVVAHDGRGNNCLYIYDSALNLLASKRIVVKKQDYSFNMSRPC